MPVLILATYRATSPPAHTVSVEQIRLIGESLDAVQAEVAAARRPSVMVFALFVLSILAPLAAAAWLVVRAERSSIGEGDMIRALIFAGATEPVLRQFVADAERGRLPFTALTRRPFSTHEPRRPRNDEWDAERRAAGSPCEPDDGTDDPTGSPDSAPET